MTMIVIEWSWLCVLVGGIVDVEVVSRVVIVGVTIRMSSRLVIEVVVVEVVEAMASIVQELRMLDIEVQVLVMIHVELLDRIQDVATGLGTMQSRKPKGELASKTSARHRSLKGSAGT